MARSWIPGGVVVCCVALAILIAGWPDTSKDEPLRVSSVPTTFEPSLTTVPPAPASSAAPTTTVPVRAPAAVPVIAFNGSAVAGSAGRLSAKLKSEGYPVGSPGPDRKPPKDASVIMYRPGFEGEAAALAAALGLDASAAQAAEATPTGWGDAEIAVVIGNDVARRL